MDVNLICSKNLYRVIVEVLSKRGFHINDKSTYLVIEKNHELPDGKIGIMFDPSSIDYLIELLDKLSYGAEISKDFIIGKLEDRYEVLSYEDILYFESCNGEISLRTSSNVYKVKDKLYELENKLSKEGFVRVSKANIVNILNVKHITPWFGGRLLLDFKSINVQIEVTRNYVRDFKEYLDM